jgi:hypothetical protein
VPGPTIALDNPGRSRWSASRGWPSQTRIPEVTAARPDDGRSRLRRPGVGAISGGVHDVPGVAIERRRDALPSRTARGELVRAVGDQLARAALTIGPVITLTLPVAAWWIAHRIARSESSGALIPERPSRGGPAAIVIRWAEATIYASDEYGRLGQRSIGAARIDVER